MGKRYVNKDFLKYVTTLPCCIAQGGFYSCSGPIQAHHLLKPYDKKRGMSLKAGDNNAIPLCMYHHQLLHTKFGDEYKFFANYGLKKDFGKKKAKELFDKFNNRSSYLDEDNYLPF